MHHTVVDKAEPGDNVDSTSVDYPQLTSAVVTSLDTQTTSLCSYVTRNPVGQIQLMDIPKAVAAGYTPMFHAHTAQVTVRLWLLEKTSKAGKEPTHRSL